MIHEHEATKTLIGPIQGYHINVQYVLNEDKGITITNQEIDIVFKIEIPFQFANRDVNGLYARVNFIKQIDPDEDEYIPSKTYLGDMHFCSDDEGKEYFGMDIYPDAKTYEEFRRILLDSEKMDNPKLSVSVDVRQLLPETNLKESFDVMDFQIYVNRELFPFD